MVVRQIAESGMLENATTTERLRNVVATSAPQRDALMNQLGDRVEIVDRNSNGGTLSGHRPLSTTPAAPVKAFA